MALTLLPGVALSPSDFGHAMASLIPSNDSRTRPFSDREVAAVQDLLVRTGRRSWSARPKTYAVLRLTGRPDLMQAFVVEGLTDDEFPYRRETLPVDISDDPEVCELFLSRQWLVVGRIGDKDRGDAGRGGECCLFAGDLILRTSVAVNSPVFHSHLHEFGPISREELVMTLPW